MDNNKRKKLLNDLCYVDADLKITEDVAKAVGFVDVIFDTGSDVHYVINFFECIGIAQSGKEALNLIQNWLLERYGHHYLAEFLFEPIIPLVTSIGLCNENEALIVFYLLIKNFSVIFTRYLQFNFYNTSLNRGEY